MSKFCTDRHKTSRRLPLAVYALGFAIFAQGTSELILTGLLPDLAHDLQISISRAGLLISAFAIGMLVGAPILAVLARRWPRRRALVLFLVAFALSQCIGALAPSYEVLLVSRIAGAFVYAGFWAVGAATIDLVPDAIRGRAMGVVAGGLPLATLVGLPGGTLIGQYLGWRSALWVIAALCAVALVAILATIPSAAAEGADDASAPRRGLGEELRALSGAAIWSAYGTTALAWGAAIVTFSYLSPLLTHSAGLASHWVPAVLALYGVAAVAGIALGGRAADRRPTATLCLGIGALVIASAALGISSHDTIAVVALVGALGFVAYATNPILNARPLTLAPAAPTLAAALNVSAFNTGITIAPWLGGLAIDGGLGYGATAWIGAILGTAALLLVVPTVRLERRLKTASRAPRRRPGRRASEGLRKPA